MKTKITPDGRALYHPIGEIEDKLDREFKSWSIVSVEFGQINKMVTCIVSCEFEALSGIRVTRQGVSAMRYGENPLDYQALPALAFKNATKSLSRDFGRDLNRDENIEKKVEDLKKEIMEEEIIDAAISDIRNGSKIEEVLDFLHRNTGIEKNLLMKKINTKRYEKKG